MDQTALGFLLDCTFCMPAYWASTGTVIASLLKYYNVPLSISNIVGGFTSTLLVLQVVGGYLYSRSKHKNAVLRISNTAWRLCVPVIFFSVLLPTTSGAAVAVAAYFLMVGLYQIACPSQTEWMINHIEGRANSNYLAVRDSVFMFSYTAAFAIVNLLLNSAQNSGEMRSGFLQIGIFLSIMILGSLPILFKLPPPAETSRSVSASGSIKEVFRNKLFMRVLMTSAIWCMGQSFVGNFSAVYQINVLQLKFSTILLWVTAANLVRSFLSRFVPRLARRFGWKTVVAASITMYLANALVLTLTTRQNAWLLFPLTSFLSNFPFAGLNVAFLQLQMVTTPRENRSMYFSVFATANGLFALGGTALCSLAIEAVERTLPSASPEMLRFVFPLGALAILASILVSRRIIVPNKSAPASIPEPAAT